MLGSSQGPSLLWLKNKWCICRQNKLKTKAGLQPYVRESIIASAAKEFKGLQ